MNNQSGHPSDPKSSLIMRVIRLVVAALILSLATLILAWFGWLVLPWVLVPKVIEPHMRELGRAGGWGPEFTAALTVIAVVLSVFFFRRLFTTNWRRHWTAVAVLAGLVVVYFGLHMWFSRGQLYDSAGRPIFYWGLTPQGTIYKQFEPGINPYTHQQLTPASADYLALVRARLQDPLKQVDPATHDWFDVNTGWPLLWYFRNAQGQYEFYARPAIHPDYRVELEAVTVELRRQWEKQQAELQAQAKIVARQAEEKRQSEVVQRAAEQQRIQEQAQADEKAPQEKAAAEVRRRQMIIARRVREGAAPLADLEWLSPVQMVAQICPGLSADSFQQQIYEENFAGRRFRYHSRVIRLSNAQSLAELEPVNIGGIHVQIQASLKPEISRKLRIDQEADLAGTIVGFHFLPGMTNINGILGQMCVLQLGDTTGSSCQTLVKDKTTLPPPKTGGRQPFFVPMSSFRNNPPLAAAIGFTIENGVRLIFSPLLLLGRHDEADFAVPVQFPVSTYRVLNPVFAPPQFNVRFCPAPPPVRVSYYPMPVSQPPGWIRPKYYGGHPPIYGPSVWPMCRPHR